jgi:hypothetical protein
VVPPPVALEHKRIGSASGPPLCPQSLHLYSKPQLPSALRLIYSPELSSVSASPLFSRFLRAALILVSKRCIMERRFLFSAS